MNYYNDPAEYYRRREQEKQEIKSLAYYIGGAFLGFIFLQNLLYLILVFADLGKNYQADQIYQSGIDVILICVGLMLPFCLLGKKMKQTSKAAEPLAFEKPYNITAAFLAVVAGLGICMGANIVTSYITLIMEAFGVKLTSPDVAMPSGAMGVIIIIVRVVLCAALTEEICLRGYVMGNLRPYGDKFAIIVSSIMFAAIHGNLVQAPFALIAGAAIGYFSIKTGTVWTGIIIHALNNLISVFISYAVDILPEETVTAIYGALLYGLIILGGVALVLFKLLTSGEKLRDNVTFLTMREKISVFIFNPAVLLTLAYMIYITADYVAIGK